MYYRTIVNATTECVKLKPTISTATLTVDAVSLNDLGVVGRAQRSVPSLFRYSRETWRHALTRT